MLHAMVLLDVSEDWREYLIYLEEHFSRLVSDPLQAYVRT